MGKGFQPVTTPRPASKPRHKRRHRRKSKHPGNVANLQRTYRISPALKKLTGLTEATRADVVKTIWRIAKDRNLAAGRDINADADFFTCFGKYVINFYELSRLLTAHMSPIASAGTEKSTPSTAESDSDDCSSVEQTPPSKTAEATPHTPHHTTPLSASCPASIALSAAISPMIQEIVNARVAEALKSMKLPSGFACCSSHDHTCAKVKKERSPAESVDR